LLSVNTTVWDEEPNIKEVDIKVDAFQSIAEMYGLPSTWGIKMKCEIVNARRIGIAEGDYFDTTSDSLPPTIETDDDMNATIEDVIEHLENIDDIQEALKSSDALRELRARLQELEAKEKELNKEVDKTNVTGRFKGLLLYGEKDGKNKRD